VLGFGLFGGSNGYWRADALRAIRLDPSALTEDIDASVRLLRSGGRIVADPAIVSSEMAPPTIRALCRQRLRWGQGWYQVTRRHLIPVITDRQIGLRQRLGAVWVFGVGTVMAWIGAFVLPFSIAGWIGSGHSSTPRIASILFAFGTAVFLVQIAVAYRHALPDSRRLRVFGAYIVANLIFYAYLRVALVRLSHLHELAGMNEWRVTPRT
jgi:cellulose synthase/poly-beta-1,6-N-acetylglucosamine synthase-like glycosyltransferase